MADTKITDMTAATDVGGLDVVPIVQGGANKKATRVMLLTGKTGADIALQVGDGTAVSLVGILSRNIFTLITADESGVLETHGTIYLRSADSNIVMECAFGLQPDIPYVPGTSGHWDGDPDKVHEAIDRLAAAVSGLLADAIP